MSETFAAVAERAAGAAAAWLGWRPAEFWAATPAELLTALRGLAPEAGAALSGGELAALKERFPDG